MKKKVKLYNYGGRLYVEGGDLWVNSILDSESYQNKTFPSMDVISPGQINNSQGDMHNGLNMTPSPDVNLKPNKDGTFTTNPNSTKNSGAPSMSAYGEAANMIGQVVQANSDNTNDRDKSKEVGAVQNIAKQTPIGGFVSGGLGIDSGLQDWQYESNKRNDGSNNFESDAASFARGVTSPSTNLSENAEAVKKGYITEEQGWGNVALNILSGGILSSINLNRQVGNQEQTNKQGESNLANLQKHFSGLDLKPDTFEFGGQLASLKGDKHTDPSQGIELNGGIAQGGETMKDGEFIFTNEFGPGKLSYARLSDRVKSKYKGREKDRLSQESMKKELDELAQQQETHKLFLDTTSKLKAFGGFLDDLAGGVLNNMGNIAYLTDQGKNYDKVDYGTVSPELIKDNLIKAKIEQTFNRAKFDLRNSGNQSGARFRANLAALGQSEAQTQAEGQQAVENANSQIKNQAKYANQDYKIKGMQDEAANKGQALTNYYEALTGMSTNASGTMRDRKLTKNQEDTLELIKLLYPDSGLGSFSLNT